MATQIKLRVQKRIDWRSIAVATFSVCLTNILSTQNCAAQTMETNHELSAMELSLFAKTFCKDKPIRRIERLEQNFLDAQHQKELDLPSRISQLMAKIKPSQELLDQPDPCDEKREKAESHGLISKLTGSSHEGENEQIESYQYPVIKWRGIKIREIPDSVAKLTTEFEWQSKNGYGKLKYKMLVKLPEGTRFPSVFTVTFLDQNGFKLIQIGMSKNYFNQTDTENVWEANESASFTEKDYKQAKGYEVTVSQR